MTHRRRPPIAEENTDSWLMSYADMITLLMCFFIIFVSVSEPKRDKFSEITEGLANKFGSVDIQTPFAGAYAALQMVVEKNQIFRDVAIEKTDRSVEIEISGGAFFDVHSPEISTAKLPVLMEMVETFKTLDYLEYSLIVESHTSDREPENAIYKTNWDLSAARASKLVQFFIAQGIPAARIRATAYGDTRPKVSNLDLNNAPIPENRALNERVVIKLERLI